eukprot:16442671-Heterocapsa_arctica.AAC.1
MCLSGSLASSANEHSAPQPARLEELAKREERRSAVRSCCEPEVGRVVSGIGYLNARASQTHCRYLR